MKKPKYDPPTPTFPYKIRKRYNMLSVPRKNFTDTGEGMPAYTPRGVRKSALNAHISDRVNDSAWPYLRRLVQTKRAFKNRFSVERLERLDRMIEAANATCYSKLANCVIDLKKHDTKDIKKKKGWTESEWKKHMDYIGQIANPKKDFRPPPVSRGPFMPLEALLPRIKLITSMPKFKMYRRLSQDSNYRNPTKVPPAALKYVLTERTRNLATPRVLHLY